MKEKFRRASFLVPAWLLFEAKEPNVCLDLPVVGFLCLPGATVRD